MSEINRTVAHVLIDQSAVISEELLDIAVEMLSDDEILSGVALGTEAGAQAIIGIDSQKMLAGYLLGLRLAAEATFQALERHADEEE